MGAAKGDSHEECPADMHRDKTSTGSGAETGANMITERGQHMNTKFIFF